MILLAIFDAEGTVTKEIKYGETSRILTVITKNHGKISVLAGNVRKGKTGLLMATALFSHSHFTLFKSGSSSLYKLNEAELITSFSELRESLEKMAYASYFCDVTNSVMQEDSSDESQADLLLRSLYMLCKNDVNYEKIKAVFEFRTLMIAGLLPDLKQCGGCGCADNLVLLYPERGAIYCECCAKDIPSAIRINESLLAAIAYIAIAEDKKIFSFNMSDASLDYLSEVGERCVEALFEKKYKTLDYLRRVTSIG